MCDRRRARGAGAGLAPVTCASSRIALRGAGIRVARDVMCLFFLPIRHCWEIDSWTNAVFVFLT